MGRPVRRKHVGVLISGRGSNLQALIEACRAPTYPAKIVLVISNVPSAQGLLRAEAGLIPTATVNHKDFASREDFDAALDEALREAGVELLCNAGFMRLHTEGFVRRWWNHHLNIHPSLLPAFKGLHTHARVLDEGVTITGCTVHFVRPEMDCGPIVAQAAVPVLPGDTPDSLAARVLQAEHRLYPQALGLVASGAVHVEGEIVVGMTQVRDQAPFFSPPLDEAL
ncbi:MAG: phosphoribosylglycinamide formyltransferase [Alphaproteobacteria bacterium RBG_16_64_48]|nr:MAG: phosphoribosylglycinamide formyltransferase [Alphaproteobacteria bacterium RBG_16_64_48]